MITREEFALWTFERDRSVGLYKKSAKWETLDKEDQDLYLEEADYYIKLGPHGGIGWPNHILDRMNDKPITVP